MLQYLTVQLCAAIFNHFTRSYAVVDQGFARAAVDQGAYLKAFCSLSSNDYCSVHWRRLANVQEMSRELLQKEMSFECYFIVFYDTFTTTVTLL